MITDPVALAALQNLAGVTSATGTLPTGGTTGDRVGMIVSLRVAATTTIATATSGWTKLGQGQQSTTGAVMAYFEANWGAAAPAFTWGGTSVNGWIQPIVLRGAGTTATPVFGTGTTAAITLPSFTCTTKGDWVIYAVGNYGNTAYTALPTGITTYREAIGGGSTTATRIRAYVGKFPDLSDHATGARSMTGVAASWVAMSLVIHPAVAADFGMIRCVAFASSSGTNTPSATLLGAHVTGAPTGVLGVWSGSISTLGSRHITGATRGGVAMTAVPNANAQSASQENDVYYIENVTASGDVTIAGAASGTTDAYEFFYAEYDGAATSGGPDQGGNATATGTAVSVTTNGNVSAGSRLVVMNEGDAGNGRTITFDANYEPRYDYRLGATAQTPLAVQDRQYTAPGGATTTATATLGTSNTWVASIAVFKPASTGVTGTSSATVAQQTATESGTVLVTGASNKAQTSPGATSTGVIPVTGGSTGSQVASGSAAGAVSVQGQSTGAQANPGATGTGVVGNPPATGSSIASQGPASGSGTGVVPVVGASNKPQTSPSASSVGQAPASGLSAGAQASAGGTGTGKAAVTGASTGQVTIGGSGTGVAPIVGGSTGSITATGTGVGAIGNVPVSGASTAVQGSTSSQLGGAVLVTGSSAGEQEKPIQNSVGRTAVTGSSTASQGPGEKNVGTGTALVTGESGLLLTAKVTTAGSGTGGVAITGQSTGGVAITGTGSGVVVDVSTLPSTLEVVVLGPVTTVLIEQQPVTTIAITQTTLASPGLSQTTTDITVQVIGPRTEIAVVIGG